MLPVSWHSLRCDLGVGFLPRDKLAGGCARFDKQPMADEIISRHLSTSMQTPYRESPVFEDL